jgi:hypothetical protein
VQADRSVVWAHFTDGQRRELLVGPHPATAWRRRTH